MKLNTNPIEIADNESLSSALFDLFRRDDFPEMIIETGTYLGTGSTRVIAEAVEDVFGAEPLVHFYTIEANPKAYNEASKYLATRFPSWVTPVPGLSLMRKELEAFVLSDRVLRSPDAFPDVLTDSLTDMPEYYLTEIYRGVIGNPKQDWLRGLMKIYETKRLFVFLDSGGGFGWLEFQVVVEQLGDRGCILGFDDSNHVKHFRSRGVVETNADGRWKIIYDDGRVMLTERYPICHTGL